MDSFYRPTWVEVSLDALRHNIEAFRRALPEHMHLMAVVKANAYGHGAAEVVREALACGASYACVAFLDEALELRRAGITAPILVLGYTPPEAIPLAAEHDITLTVYSYEVLEALRNRASRAVEGPTASGHKPLRIHIKLDTGMGRLGLYTESEAIAFIERALQLPNVVVEGLYTHFASADERDKSYTYEQHRRFDAVVQHFNRKGIAFPYLHTGNSAVALDCPELSYNMIRLGVSMYGMYPSDEVNRDRIRLQPVMSVKTRMVMVKKLPPGCGISYGVTYRTQGEEVIGTLPIGYADGFSRMYTGQGRVLVRGRRVPVVGRICMDQCMINITDVPQASLQDEIVILGEQGAERITAEELASLLGTINYEITCMISHRVPRVYIRNGQVASVANPLIG